VTSVGEEVEASSGWAQDERGLHREFEFADFATAWRFMSRVAEEAERADHHPDWSNSFNRVNVTLISHDVGRVTNRDRRLATVIDDIHHAITEESR
jgi:4a-hydroxytetrahydrobiopterin dehydratase